MEGVEGNRGGDIGMREWIWKSAFGRWIEVRLTVSCRLHVRMLTCCGCCVVLFIPVG